MSKAKCSLHIGKFIFTFSWFLTLLTSIFLALFISLGFWQLHRAQEKKLLLQQYQTRAKDQLLNLATLDDNKIENYQYYRIQLMGHYDNTHTLLLDNRNYQHQVGYHVITPFVTLNKGVILINRGWIARNSDRRLLPTFPIEEGMQTIQGIIYKPSSKTFILSNVLENEHWPRIIQSIDFNQIERWLKQPIRPWVVLLSSPIQKQLIQDWQPQVSPQKNLGYAMQWFTFAGILLIIFFARSIKWKL